MINKKTLRFITIIVSLTTFAFIPMMIFSKKDYNYLLAVGLAAYSLYMELKYN